MTREDGIREHVKVIRQAWNAGYKVGYSEQLDLVQHIDYLLKENQRLREANEVLRDNMHQAFGYMAQCPECDGLLPKHEHACELRQALQPKDGEQE